MNKVFCDALKLAVYVYMDEKYENGQIDYFVVEKAKRLLNEATEYGLIKWIDNVPVVNTEKMTGAK